MEEKSCGAVVVQKTEDIQVLLIKVKNGGHYSFPKGHIEENETEHETARREIFEETSLRVAFIEGFRTATVYSPKDGVQKEVVYFLAVPEGGQLEKQEAEVEEIAWHSVKEAQKLITYENDRRILMEALAFLNGKTHDFFMRFNADLDNVWFL